MPTKADVFLLENGIYQCQRCVPVINIKADGQDQSVAVQRLRAAPLRQQHVAKTLERRQPKFNQFNQNGVFGKDNGRV
jgi:hypothetical protein